VASIPEYEDLLKVLGHYPAAVGSRVWVRYGKEYLEAVLAHPLSDAGLKEVLEARVDRRVKPAVLVYFPPGSLPKSSRKVEWIPVKDIVIQKRHVPPKVPCRGIRGTSAVSPVEWWLKDLSTRLLDLMDQIPLAAVLESDLSCWTMHDNNACGATTYEQLAVECQWMMNQLNRRLFTKHIHWANDEVSGMPALVRACCQPPVLVSKMEELLLLVQRRIDGNKLKRLWPKGRYNHIADQAVEPLHQPGADFADPMDMENGNVYTQVMHKGKQKLGEEPFGLKQLQDNQPRAADAAASSHQEPTIEDASADVMLMQVPELMEGDACAEIVFDKLGIDFSHVDKKHLQKLRKPVRAARSRIKRTLTCNTQLEQRLRYDAPIQNMVLCALCHQVVLTNELAPTKETLETEHLGPPIALCCGSAISRCSCVGGAGIFYEVTYNALVSTETATETVAYFGNVDAAETKKPKKKNIRKKKKSGKGAFINGPAVVHEQCAAWSQLVVCIQDDFDNIRYVQSKCKSLISQEFSLDYLLSEVRRGNRLRCRVCRLTGASIGCQVESCNARFHYPCILRSGCVYNPSTHQVYCSAHSKIVLSMCNGEWLSCDKTGGDNLIIPADSLYVRNVHSSIIDNGLTENEGDRVQG